MKAYVDERHGVVRAEDQSWPFELDCRTGTAALVLEGLTVVLRRHSWREKRNLACFVHLGEDFLKTQFLRLSLVREDALPENQAVREALWALARWLNGPQGHFGLPLDQGLLAKVTLELCRTMGLAPAALEDLEAVEVESLWQAAGGEKRPVEDAPAGTRIVVVPDPHGDESQPPMGSATPDRSGAEPKSIGTSRPPESISEATAKAPENTSKTALTHRRPDAMQVAEAADAGDQARTPLPSGEFVRGAGGRFPSGTHPAAAKGQPVSGPQRRFRVVLETVPASPGREDAASRAAQEPTTGPVAGSTNLHGFSSSAAVPVETNGAPVIARAPIPRPAAAAGYPVAVAGSIGESGRLAPQRPPALAADQQERPFTIEPGETVPGPIPEARVPLKVILDELADRLEEAAGTLGIDLEP